MTDLPAAPTNTRAAFGSFVRAAKTAGELVVQPRMGFSDPAAMRRGLLATRWAAATTVGTITVDSFTRTGAVDALRMALTDGHELNGYPIAAHPAATTRQVLEGLHGPDFPVQVRHGSAAPWDIFVALVRAGLDASEGGPVSYCLPYSRLPLRQSVANWTRCCGLFARLRDAGAQPHLETFGGCMLGQLCPPSLLVALSVLEALFFRRHGVHSISLSYAQQTHAGQDEEAVAALRRLAEMFLADTDWHIVIYAYMGVYPRTVGGSTLLGEAAARLAVRTGAERLIVKTAAEASRIPTVRENVAALEVAAAAAKRERAMTVFVADTGILAEARALVEAVLQLSPDIGEALVIAFERGFLDVPFCLHPDNAGRARSYLAPSGRLGWTDIGTLPVAGIAEVVPAGRMAAADLLASLHWVADRYDRMAAGAVTARETSFLDTSDAT
jgi:methylaspartate mutase epsilon subunit